MSIGAGPLIGSLVNRWFTDEFQAANPDKITIRAKQITDTPVDVFLNVFRIYAETEMSPANSMAVATRG